MKVEQEPRRIFFQKASKENGFSEEEESGRRCGIEDQQEGGWRKPGKDDRNADYNDGAKDGTANMILMFIW